MEWVLDDPCDEAANAEEVEQNQKINHCFWWAWAAVMWMGCEIAPKYSCFPFYFIIYYFILYYFISFYSFVLKHIFCHQISGHCQQDFFLECGIFSLLSWFPHTLQIFLHH